MLIQHHKNKNNNTKNNKKGENYRLPVRLVAAFLNLSVRIFTCICQAGEYFSTFCTAAWHAFFLVNVKLHLVNKLEN